MRIEKGHYVSKASITSETLFNLVVVCFQAAGAVSDADRCQYTTSNHPRGLIFGFSGKIGWLVDGDPVKLLTLQELLTAENSIQWPEWAVDIRVDNQLVYFTDGVRKCRTVSLTPVSGILTSDDCVLSGDIIATRKSVGNSQVQSEDNPWFDYDKQQAIAGTFPEHLERVIVNPASGKKFEVVGQSSDGSVVVQQLDNGALCSFHLHQLKPLDWNRTELEQKRQQFVEAALSSLGHHFEQGDYQRRIMEHIYNSGRFELKQSE